MVNVSKLRNKSVSTLVNSLRSQGTKANYYSTLKKYFEFLNPGLEDIPDKIMVDARSIMNPDKVQAIDEVSLEYVKDPEVKTMTGDIDYEDDLRRYRDEALSDHAESTRKYKFRVIFRYLGANQIEFDSTFMKNIVGEGHPATSMVEMVPTPTQFDNLMDRCNPAARAALVLMAKAGMRPGEVLIAKLNDLDLNFKAQYVDSETGQEMSVPIGKLFIPKAKGSKPRDVYLIKEVEDELKDWLSRRSDYIKDLEANGYHKGLEDERIFPYGESTLRSMWGTALGRCNMAQRETVTKMMRNRLVYRLHNQRKFFRIYGQWQNPDVAEAQMGHQEGMSKIYARMDKAMELMVKGIKQAEPYLTSRRLRTHNIDDIREENEQLRLKMAQMNEKIDSLEGLKEDMAFQMGEMKSMIEQLAREQNIELWDQVEAIPKETEPNEDAEREEAEQMDKVK